jgi:hypothetical protein
MNKKSGQEVAKQSNGLFSKTDVRYWQDAIFKPTYKRNGQILEIGRLVFSGAVGVKRST